MKQNKEKYLTLEKFKGIISSKYAILMQSIFYFFAVKLPSAYADGLELGEVQSKGDQIISDIYGLVFNWGRNLLVLAILICIIGWGFSDNPQKKEMYKDRFFKAAAALVLLTLIGVIVKAIGGGEATMPTWN